MQTPEHCSSCRAQTLYHLHNAQLLALLAAEAFLRHHLLWTTEQVQAAALSQLERVSYPAKRAGISCCH